MTSVRMPRTRGPENGVRCPWHREDRLTEASARTPGSSGQVSILDGPTLYDRRHDRAEQGELPRLQTELMPGGHPRASPAVRGSPRWRPLHVSVKFSALAAADVRRQLYPHGLPHCRPQSVATPSTWLSTSSCGQPGRRGVAGASLNHALTSTHEIHGRRGTGRTGFWILEST